jgi:hypothetical protein
MSSSKKNKEFGFSFPNMAMEMPPVGAFWDAQRKNAAAVTEAMQCTMRGLQKAMTRQAEMVTRMVQDNARLGESFAAETPERRMQLQADMIGHVYRMSADGVQEVRRILSETEQEMAEIIGTRFNEGFDEMQKVLVKRDTRRAAAAE